ncbi:MAG: methylglyoxal synthase [Paenibacillaceae bacterium]|nr:methylglyoxal synthase [Paenibacillaceae bacterium]
MMRIALIAHDKKKDELVNFVLAYVHIFARHTLYATGTTGARVMEATQLPIQRLRSGPLGGDQQIGAMICSEGLDVVLFFRDPLMAQPHEPDIIALLRLCDVYGVPLATNLGTAECLIRAIDADVPVWQKGQTLGYDALQ